MDICFWVTTKCNLSCTYCYVNKQDDVMTLDTAKQAVNFVIPFLKKNETNNVRFHGGEPLLNSGVVEYIIKELKDKVSNKPLKFYLTTNGTITQNIEYIIKNVGFSVSLDGLPHNNNRNRIYKNNKGTYAEIDKFIRKLNMDRIRYAIRMTVHPSNTLAFYDNFIFIYCNYGVIPNFALDYSSAEWNEKNITDFFKQLKKIIQFLYEKDRTQGFELVHNLKREYLSKRYSCTGGEKSLHISSSGTIFPCYLAVGREKYVIGNIFEGLDNNQIEKICEESKKPNDICKDCGLENNCKSRSCKIVNEIYTGDPYTPSGIKCMYTRNIYKIIMEFQEYE